MLSTRIITCSDTTITKKSGKCSLEEEIERFKSFKENGLNVPKVIYFDCEKNLAEFELIKNYPFYENVFDYSHQRGFIEGTMARLGFYHPSFATSYDDTSWNNNKELYLIDGDDQIPITFNGSYLGSNKFDDTEVFKTQILPSMSLKDILLDNKLDSENYLRGYREGIRTEIRIDEDQFSSVELTHKALLSGL